MAIALHLRQDLQKACDTIRLREALTNDVATYREWACLKSEAIEDEDFGLATDLGRSMKALRESHSEWRWLREMSKQESSHD